MGQKTTAQIYAQRQSIFSRAMRLADREAARVHPETGGSQHLVHNWGNAQAKAAVAYQWTRWRKIEVMAVRLYAAAEHRGHDGKFKAMWCAECQA